MESWLQGPEAHVAWNQAFAFLLDIGVKGVLLLTLAGLAALTMRQASSAARHLIWILALAGLVLLPVFTLVMPQWNLPILPGPSLTANLAPTAPPVNHSAPIEAPVILEASSPGPARAGSSMTSSLPLRSQAFWAVSSWLAGAAALIIWLAVGMLALSRQRRRMAAFEGPRLPELARSLAETLGLRRPVAILRAERGAMPMTGGILRSAVFLPREAEDWPEEKQRAVLLHELAHVKRRDCLIHALARFAIALHWFNPLAWVALRNLRIERERACDDLVLTAGQRPSSYADHLLEIACTTRTHPLAAAAAITMARKSQLEGRLLAVLDGGRRRGAIHRWWVVLGVLALIIVIIPLALTKLDRPPTVYRAEFSRGIRVELLGVGETERDPDRMAWAPDGENLDHVPEQWATSGAFAYPSNNELVRQFYLRLHYPEYLEENINWSFWINGRKTDHAAHYDENLIHIQLVHEMPKDQKRASLKIQIGVGPWTKLADGAIGQNSILHDNEQTSYSISDWQYDEDRPYLFVNNLPNDRDIRLVGYDEIGREFVFIADEEAEQSEKSRKKFIFQYRRASNESIAQLVLQMRDYEWQTIKGIALHPDSSAG